MTDTSPPFILQQAACALVPGVAAKGGKQHPVDTLGSMMKVLHLDETKKLSGRPEQIEIHGQKEPCYLVRFKPTVCSPQQLQIPSIWHFIQHRYPLPSGQAYVVWKDAFVPVCYMETVRTHDHSNGREDDRPSDCPFDYSRRLSNPKACLHELIAELLDQIFREVDEFSLYNVYRSCRRFALHLEPRIQKIVVLHAGRPTSREVWEFGTVHQHVRALDPSFVSPDGTRYRAVLKPNPLLFQPRRSDPRNVWANHFYRGDNRLRLGHTIVELARIHSEKPNDNFVSPGPLQLFSPPAQYVVAAMKVCRPPIGLESVAVAWHVRNEEGVRLHDILRNTVATLHKSPDERFPPISIDVPGAVYPTTEEITLVNQKGYWEADQEVVIGKDATHLSSISVMSVEEVQGAFDIHAISASPDCDKVEQPVADCGVGMGPTLVDGTM